MDDYVFEKLQLDFLLGDFEKQRLSSAVQSKFCYRKKDAMIKPIVVWVPCGISGISNYIFVFSFSRHLVE